MSSDRSFFASFEIECARLGLDWRDLPGLAIADGAEGEAQFLEHLRQLSPGVTWHVVFPGMPAHWIPGEPDTWTWPYRPLGAFDHQQLPTGPAVMIGWDDASDRTRLAPLVASARAAGFPIFGAGFLGSDTPESTTLAAYIVFDRGVSEDRVMELYDWLEERGDAAVLSIVRTGTGSYPQP